MTFISTAGHGYLQITHNQLKKALDTGFVPTTFSFINKRNVLLEEDCDASAYLKHTFADDYADKYKTIKSTYQNDINKGACFVIPTNMEEYDNFKNKIISYQNLTNGTILISYGDEKFTSTGSYQKKSAIVRDEKGGVWTLPFTNTKEIILAS